MTLCIDTVRFLTLYILGIVGSSKTIRQAILVRPQDPTHAAPKPCYGRSQALHPRLLHIYCPVRLIAASR